VIAYPAMLDVPRELAWFLARLLAAHRRELGTRPGTRALSCFKQAVFALVWFREKRSIPLAGKGFGISQATSYRYLDEAIGVLAACAPDLHDALRRVAAEGWSHVILDGKVVDSDRCAEKTLNTHGEVVDAWYAGKTHDFGGNVQAVMRPDGLPVWISQVAPGSTHDLTAARDHTLGALCWAASQLNLPTLADPGYQGAGIGVHTPIKQPPGGQRLAVDNRAYNKLLRALRALGERGFALLTGRWRCLQHVTTSPSKIGDIAQSALILTHFEHNYLPH
jgi:DDE superfamily endonuclease